MSPANIRHGRYNHAARFSRSYTLGAKCPNIDSHGYISGLGPTLTVEITRYTAMKYRCLMQIIVDSSLCNPSWILQGCQGNKPYSKLPAPVP
jgi:hypothetical protein